MPQAFPIFPGWYVQFLPPDPQAPAIETDAWTQEVKGKRRYGTGVLYRLPGPVRIGVHLGRWTDRPVGLRQQIAAERQRRDHGLRLIREDEEGLVLEGVADMGWEPPVWHWRHWLFLGYRAGFLYKDAYGDLKFRRPGWTRPTTKWSQQMRLKPGTTFEGDHLVLADATIQPDPGWDDEVRAVAFEMQRQRREREQ
jgi:hypothetical protein